MDLECAFLRFRAEEGKQYLADVRQECIAAVT